MKRRPPCAGLWNTPTVRTDGRVTTCCLDEHMENALGDLSVAPLEDLWHGQLINDWRFAHAEGRFEDSGPFCSRCNWQSAGFHPEEETTSWLESEEGQAATLRYSRADGAKRSVR